MFRHSCHWRRVLQNLRMLRQQILLSHLFFPLSIRFELSKAFLFHLLLEVVPAGCSSEVLLLEDYTATTIVWFAAEDVLREVVVFGCSPKTGRSWTGCSSVSIASWALLAGILLAFVVLAMQLLAHDLCSLVVVPSFVTFEGFVFRVATVSLVQYVVVGRRWCSTSLSRSLTAMVCTWALLDWHKSRNSVSVCFHRFWNWLSMVSCTSTARCAISADSRHSTCSASLTTLDFHFFGFTFECSSCASLWASCARNYWTWSFCDGIVVLCATVCANFSCQNLPCVACWATTRKHPSCWLIRLLIQLVILSWKPRMKSDMLSVCTHKCHNASWNRRCSRMLSKSVFLSTSLGPLERKLSFCILVLTAHNLCRPVTNDCAMASGHSRSLSHAITFGPLNLEPAHDCGSAMSQISPTLHHVITHDNFIQWPLAMPKEAWSLAWQDLPTETYTWNSHKSKIQLKLWTELFLSSSSSVSVTLSFANLARHETYTTEESHRSK